VNTAIIAPSKFLKSWGTQDFCWCFASIAAEDSGYLAFHKRRRDMGATVILDHSPGVPRKPVSHQLLFEMIGRLGPTHVVLPDSDFTTEKTIRAAQEFTRRYGTLDNIQYIGMIQGTTLVELERCYQQMRTLSHIIGLPSSNEKILTRNEIIEALDIDEPTFFFEIHKDPMEELPDSPTVTGLATSWPVRLGLTLRTLDEYEPTPKPLDFSLTQLESQYTEIIKRNISEFLSRVG